MARIGHLGEHRLTESKTNDLPVAAAGLGRRHG